MSFCDFGESLEAEALRDTVGADPGRLRHARGLPFTALVTVGQQNGEHGIRGIVQTGFPNDLVPPSFLTMCPKKVQHSSGSSLCNPSHPESCGLFFSGVLSVSESPVVYFP